MVEVPSQSGKGIVEPPPPVMANMVKRNSSGTLPERARDAGTLDTVVRTIWRFFSSVRAAIWEIGFLALLTLIGTLRGSSVPETLATHVPALRGLVDTWYGWDVFGSWLFTAMLAVIAVAIIVGGMLNRIPTLWSTIAHPTVTTTQGFLRGTAPHAHVSTGAPPEDMVEDIAQALRRRRYRVLTANTDTAIHIYADRNRWGKLGTFPFHIALVMLVVGGIVVTQFGFRDVAFVVPEGETVPIGRGTGLSVHLNTFNEDYYQDGTAAKFQSNVSILRGDSEVRSGGVEPNRPLSAGGVTVYQSGFGYNVSLRVTDRNGNQLFEGPVTLGQYQASTNPDAPAGILRVPGTNTTLNLIASDRDIANRPDLDTLNLSAEQLYVQARTDDALPTATPATAIVDPVNPGRLGDLVVEFERYGVYSVLQVAYYPGLWIFGVAAVIGILGLIAIFYFPLRRIRAIVTNGGQGRSSVTLAPLARRDWSGKRDFMLLVEDLRAGKLGDIAVSEAPANTVAAPRPGST